MTRLQINKELEIKCEWKKTSRAFNHEATLLKNGEEIDKVKICYINRTWESFEFESVINKLLDKTKILTNRQRKAFLKKASSGQDSNFKSILMATAVGNILCKTQKQKNDWKTRMLKAGLENKGLIMPENWNELSENEKERRLKGALKQLA